MNQLLVEITTHTRSKFSNYFGYDIIICCHLRWDFVYQRPQHIIARLAQDYNVLVVEEPYGQRGDQKYETYQPKENITILKPFVNTREEIGTLLTEELNITSIPVLWIYSPAFVSIKDALEYEVLVYDCMDELSLFKFADPALTQQEQRLLAAADLVFTGGTAIYDAKKSQHDAVHCFPSSVEEHHFSKNKAAIPADISTIPHPIVGYYGVIDERIDYELLANTARLMPEINFVMVGPLAKVNEENLPKAINIFYLGMKKYEELPAYLKAFDIAMMPFALNDATKYISPTKTLEYMAGSKPIISTPIQDVVRHYGNVVEIVANVSTFKAAIERILSAPQTLAAYDEILSINSWDTTVSKMKNLIKQLQD